MASHARPWGSADRARAAPATERDHHAPLRIPTIAAFAVISATLLALIAIVPLIWSSHTLGQATERLALDADRVALENQIERNLDSYNRVSNVQLLTSVDLSDERRELLSSLRTLLDRAPDHARNEGERRAIAEVDREVDAYLDARDRLGSSALPASQIVRESSANFERAKHALGEWRETSVASTRDAFGDAERADRIALVIASTAAAVLVVLVIALAFLVRQNVLVPITGLHRTITRLRAGDTDVHAQVRGAFELREVSRALNDLIDTAARHRHGELAFLASVAHDLRNPLAAMKMAVQILAETQQGGTNARTIAMLDRQTDRLAHMVDELFDATRVAAGQIELHRAPFDLRESVRHTVQLLELSAPAHELVAHLPSAPVIVDGDARRIEQVVNNLVSNAIKYAPDAPRIDIRVASDGEWAELSVTDRGIDIPKDEIPDLFMPFRRHATKVAPGTGLGLSVVQRIVTAHGGRIDVESTVGAGSTFRVRLPRVASEQPSTEA